MFISPYMIIAINYKEIRKSKVKKKKKEEKTYLKVHNPFYSQPKSGEAGDACPEAIGLITCLRSPQEWSHNKDKPVRVDSSL